MFSLSNWLSLIDRLENKIIYASEAVLENIKDICQEEPLYLCNNMRDPYILSQFNICNITQVPISQAYFCAIASLILSQDQDSFNGLLSAQEESFLKISSSIQFCKTGKLLSINTVYEHLKVSYIFSTKEDIQNLSAQTIVESFIKDFVKMHIEILLGSNSSFMRSVTRSPLEVSQLSHQSLYIKNMLVNHLNLDHKIVFDPSSFCIDENLLALSLDELLESLKSQLDVTQLILAIKQGFISLRKKNLNLANKFYNAACEILPSHLPLDQIWLLNFEYPPQIESLTNEGAMQILEKALFIKKETSPLEEKINL